MLLLDSATNQDLDCIPNELLFTLKDIVNKVQINSYFSIGHPDYKPLEIPNQLVGRFQKMPLNLQSKYLNKQLQSFVYDIYYNGSLRTSLTLDVNSANFSLHQNLENNTWLEVNTEFVLRLHESNVGQGYFNPGWHILRQENDGTLAVKKDALTLHVERDRHLQPAEHSATIGEEVSIRLPRNLLQNGFYVAMSNLGGVIPGNSADDSTTVGIYFNFSSEGAVALMNEITQQLNEITIPFSFKVLYNPSDYGRYDSGILYFNRKNYQAVWQLIKKLYTKNILYFGIKIPLFTKLLAPGLGLAEEPDCKFFPQENFGMNRSQIIALGLLEAWQKGNVSPQDRMASILKHFAMFGVSLQRPYLNKNSEDIYSPLDC